MKWIEWVEPFVGAGKQRDYPVYMRVTPDAAIAYMKDLQDYDSDEEALADFMGVYWAKEVEVPDSREKWPDKPDPPTAWPRYF
jgi:hypothetical protein